METVFPYTAQCLVLSGTCYASVYGVGVFPFFSTWKSASDSEVDSLRGAWTNFTVFFFTRKWFSDPEVAGGQSTVALGRISFFFQDQADLDPDDDASCFPGNGDECTADASGAVVRCETRT